jgi:hypothetical protein
MSMQTALAIVALLATHNAAPHREAVAGAQHSAGAPDSVLAEMAPAPGRWEVEDAPAYFSDSKVIRDAPAPGEPVADGDPAYRAEPREGEALVARRHP